MSQSSKFFENLEITAVPHVDECIVERRILPAELRHRESPLPREVVSENPGLLRRHRRGQSGEVLSGPTVILLAPFYPYSEGQQLGDSTSTRAHKAVAKYSHREGEGWHQ
jgi:hypothetical protein